MTLTCRLYLISLAFVAVLVSPVCVFAQSANAQEIYNAAQNAFDKGDWGAAISGFERVAKPDTGAPISHAQAIIRARLAQAYAKSGDPDPALASAQIALKGLSPDDAYERVSMWLSIANAKRLQSNMTEAVEYYDKVIRETSDPSESDFNTSAQIGKGLALITVNPEAAGGIFTSLIPRIAVDSPAAKLNLAQLQDYIGRTLLNAGKLREALTMLKLAGTTTGGMNTTRINYTQLAIRGDAAIAAQLLKDSDTAREYLAYTGAGHLPSDEWTRGIGSPPVCNPDGGLKPDDVAVVEFSIAADGHVIGAAPIYASRAGDTGATFAKAVMEWRWNPEKLAKLEAFWRNSVRLELRCVSRPKPQDMSVPFRRQFIQWIREKGPDADTEALERRGYIAATDARLETDSVGSIFPISLRLLNEDNSKQRELLG